MDKEIARGERMLSNQGFLAKAPKALVEEETRKLDMNREKKAKLLSQLALMQD